MFPRCYFLKHVSVFCPCLASVVKGSSVTPFFSQDSPGWRCLLIQPQPAGPAPWGLRAMPPGREGRPQPHLSSPCSFELHSSQFAKFKLSFSRKALYPDHLNQASPSSSSWPFRNVPSINYHVCHQVIKISTPCHQIIFLKKCSSFPVNNQSPAVLGLLERHDL